MHKNATKYNETLSKWCKNKHGASKIIDTFETYQPPLTGRPPPVKEKVTVAMPDFLMMWTKPWINRMSMSK
jgi:hypothetical protein